MESLNIFHLTINTTVMKTTLLLAVACLAWLASAAQYNLKNLSIASHATAEKFTWKNMRIYPVYARTEFVKAQGKTSHYETLPDALKKKKVIITEAKQGETVNTLFAENLSSDTVIILGGDVIAGGKQDRMISADVILPPKSGKKDLSVYCVEHGRWQYRGSRNEATTFQLTTLSAAPKMKKAASVRKDQSEVWKEVKVVTDSNKASSSTGAYTALASSKNFTSDITAYRTFFKTILSRDTTIIGFVAVSGDSILGCDLFASHSLLIKHVDRLLNSYSTAAVTEGSPVKVTGSRVTTYMNKLLADESKQEDYIKKNGMQLKEKDRKLHIAVY